MRRAVAAIILLLVIVAITVLDLMVKGSLLAVLAIPLCGIALLFGIYGLLLGWGYVLLLWLLIFSTGRIESFPSWQIALVVLAPGMVAVVESIRRHRRRLQCWHERLFDSIGEGVLFTDNNLALLQANPAARALLLLPADAEDITRRLGKIGLLTLWAACRQQEGTVVGEFTVEGRALRVTIQPVMEEAEMVGMLTLVAANAAERHPRPLDTHVVNTQELLPPEE